MVSALLRLRPVASPSAVSMLNKAADQVVCLMEPRHFVSVAHWYQEFEPLTDKLVCEKLERSVAEWPKEKSA